MIRTVLEMRVREGRTDEFERAWRSAASVAACYRGAGLQTMLRDPAAPLHYTIMADWAGHDELAAYQRSSDRQALSAILEELRESATRSLLEIVVHVAAAPPSVSPPGPAPLSPVPLSTAPLGSPRTGAPTTTTEGTAQR